MPYKAVILSVVSFYAFLILPLAPVFAQGQDSPDDLDLTAPVIRYDPSRTPAAFGVPIEIVADVTDNQGIDEVTLFYRVKGMSSYSRITMRSEGGGFYSAVIPKENATEAGIEFYIQASDQSGNVALRGFAGEPILMAVAPMPPAPETQEPPLFTTEAPVLKPWYKKWWVWTMVVVVAGGAAAAAANGSDRNKQNGPTPTGNQGGSVQVAW